MFRVSEQDARSLADGFSFFEAKDLLNLGVGEAIARVEQAAFDFNLRTTQLGPVDSDLADYRQEIVREFSRSNYATAREEIEESLRGAAPDRPPERPPEPPPAPPSPSKPPQSTPNGGSPQAAASLEHDEALAAKPSRPVPGAGRGGPQHKYLQALIKRAADDRSFRTTIEKPVLDGHGHVDVALEHAGLSIGCEVSITTDVEHELNNLSKCLAAGFDFAVLICSDKHVLNAAKSAFVAELSDAQQQRLRFLTPESFFSFLDETVAELKSRTETVRGYNVSTKYKAPSDEERKRREKVLEDVISKSLRRKKKK